ncbi:PLD nuclease N-terminal domain-containing protein [Saccharopolyspora oryzae]|uniref:PLD nuclease N-terminal domain-containing protein n=1 Tax=Saccharopolyspora oryzae TaxID=2997343 RepID=A0ABT4V7F6_9PSEU|nr:PLD nuclease N-terminal domain-containing protein [Saccharopolyspora oryzae]MDA3629899.1 PLD nuclease N-terminal domain-containing protein [Saccharopolyspora oryzae]
MHAVVQQASLALDNEAFTSGLFLFLIALPVLVYVVLVVGALISVLGSPQSFGMKVVWIVFVFVAPFLGSILWFLIGRGNAYERA